MFPLGRPGPGPAERLDTLEPGGQRAVPVILTKLFGKCDLVSHSQENAAVVGRNRVPKKWDPHPWSWMQTSQGKGRDMDRSPGSEVRVGLSER